MGMWKWECELNVVVSGGPVVDTSEEDIRWCVVLCELVNENFCLLFHLTVIMLVIL